MLNIQERQAWFILGVFGLCMVAYMIAVSLVGFRESALAAFSLFGLTGFAPVIRRKDRRTGQVMIDERDEKIGRTASLASFAFFWVLFVFVCMSAFFLKGPHGTITIPVIYPPMFVILGMIISMTVRSLVIIVMYRKGAHGQAE